MGELITLSHGSGGKAAIELVNRIFVKRFEMTGPLTDSALIERKTGDLAFTTDSFVINPIFFPGGNIGKLAVCGTVNDLAVSGASPQYLAVSFIIEEGLPVKDLETIVISMAEEASNAGVVIITGDTKVVERGKCDGLFITATGLGYLNPGLRHISTGGRITAGDKLIVNGSLGNHSVAVLGVRNNLSFTTPLISDCATLNRLIGKVMEHCDGVHFMRDLTRGGLVAVLNELAGMTGKGIVVNERDIPVDEPVKGLCELLGFDPMYLANEGKVLFVVAEEEYGKAVDILRSDPLGKGASVIGEVSADDRGIVILKTLAGGKRILDMPPGIQLPRIC